jgi:hypothetical protein
VVSGICRFLVFIDASLICHLSDGVSNRLPLEALRKSHIQVEDHNVEGKSTKRTSKFIFMALAAVLFAIFTSLATDIRIISWNLLSYHTTFLNGPSWELFEALSTRVSELEGLMSSELCEGLVQHYFNDRIGRRDFALRTGGSLVIDGLTTQTSEPASYHPFWSLFNFGSRDHRRNLPDIALTHNPQLAFCWKVDAPHGQLGISLPEPVLITHITIDHISRDFTSHIDFAPRTVYVWGVLDGDDNLRQILTQRGGEVASVLSSRQEPAITGGLLFIPLVRLVYDIYAANHVQTFPVIREVAEQHIEFKEVVVEFVDNWGGSSTCLHRVRIHGMGKDGSAT